MRTANLVLAGSKLEYHRFRSEFPDLENVMRITTRFGPTLMAIRIQKLHLYGTAWMLRDYKKIISAAKLMEIEIIDHYHMPYQVFMPSKEIYGVFAGRMGISPRR